MFSMQSKFQFDRAQQLVDALLNPTEEKPRKFKCREGWIYVYPLPYNRCLIQATNQGKVTVSALDMRSVVRDLAKRLGGFEVGVGF